MRGKMGKFLLALLTVLIISSSAFAGNGSKGEINVKVGLGLFGSVNMEEGKDENGNLGYILGYVGDAKHSATSNIGTSFGAEYLYPVSSVLKAGVGAEYMLSRKMISLEYDDGSGGYYKVDMSASYIPVYVTVQANPLKKIPGIFIKGNIGYAFFNTDNLNKDITKFFNETYFPGDGDIVKINDKGGLYFAFSAGYEFDFGLLLDLSYSYFQSSLDARTDYIGGWDTSSAKFNYGLLGMNAGYKFKL